MTALHRPLKIVCLLLASIGICPCQRQQSNEAKARALACLSPTDDTERNFLGVRSGGLVKYRFRSGGIPDTSDDDIKEPKVVVVFYSPDLRRAAVTEALFSKRWVLARSNIILPRYQSGRWELLEASQGGLGFYSSVEKMMSQLDIMPIKTTRLPTRVPSYCISEMEWNRPGSPYLDKR